MRDPSLSDDSMRHKGAAFRAPCSVTGATPIYSRWWLSHPGEQIVAWRRGREIKREHKSNYSDQSKSNEKRERQYESKEKDKYN